MSVLHSLPAPSLLNLAPPDHSLVPQLPLYRLSVAQYHDMLQKGILKSGESVELLEGLLVVPMTIHPPHTFTTESLRDLLPRLLPSGWFVNAQQPVTTEDSEPEPDVAVPRGERRHYLTAHPGPEHLALVVEVADTSLATDRGVKLRLYARAAIPVYWIVNLIDRQVEVYTDPTGPGEEPTYRDRQNFGPDAVVPVVLDGQEVGRLSVRDLLP